MIPKYQMMMHRVHDYIYNAIHRESSDNVISKEVLKRYPLYACFYKVDTEMTEEFTMQLIMFIRKTHDVTSANITSIYEAPNSQQVAESDNGLKSTES